MENKKYEGRFHFEFLNIMAGRLNDGTFNEILDDWKWIFGYSARYKGAIFFYVLLGIFGSTMGLTGAVVSKYLIDIVTGYKKDKLLVLILLMVFSSVSGLVTRSMINRISARISIYIYTDIQSDIFGKVIDADWMALSRFSNGDILNRFSEDIKAVSDNAVSWLPTIIIAGYNFLATFVVLWYYDPVMAMIAFISAPFMLFSSRYIIKKQRAYGKKTREVAGRMMSFESEALYNIDTIKSFGITGQYGRKMKERQKEYKEVSLDYNKFTIATNIFMSVLAFLVHMVSFFYCIFLLWNHRITYGTMTLFLQQRSLLSSAFNSAVSTIPNFLSASISAHRIRALMELPREVHVPDSSKLDQYVKDGFRVEMDDVDFSYEEDQRVISDSSFKAKPGEIVALVGPSGEGKTTMIRLLLGLVRPDEGFVRILANGQNDIFIDANAESRYLFAYVPQGNTMIAGTIADNLRMVKEDATDEEIIEALKTACAWDFIKKMKDGINSSVKERGKGLSEGQAQRVAIARAILRDAPVLLLDEATSALDVATERKVLKNIIKNHPNKTCIVTTHRPSVLHMCERVYRVMETKVTELTVEESAQMAMDF